MHAKSVDFRFWALFALLAACPAAGAAEAPPVPEPNPQRQVMPSQVMPSQVTPSQVTPSKDTAVPEAPPPLPGDRPTVAWKDPKVEAARNACAQMLDGLDLDYEQLDPIKKGLCGAPAAIKVRSIGKDPAVAISPPATMTCTLAVALHAWFKDTVQPAAVELGTNLVKIRNASSYKCRNRYGRTDTRISEHALANALDISEFVFASGRSIKLLGNWPYGAQRTFTLTPGAPVPNPQRTAVRVKSNPFVRPVVPASHAPPPADGSPQGADPAAASPRAKVKSNPFVSPLPPEAAEAVTEAKPAEAKSDEDRQRPPSIGAPDAAAFLKILHREACKTFETVLGPDANAAHKDHFHLDMKKRRYVKICE